METETPHAHGCHGTGKGPGAGEKLSPLTTTTEGISLTLTEKAIQKVHAFAEGNKEAQGKHLRIYVQGGGCSGFEYGFTFDESKQDDTILEQGGIKILLDPMSLPYLRGSTVDFTEDFRGSGFVVQNPNAKTSCGCGTSFSV